MITLNIGTLGKSTKQIFRIREVMQKDEIRKNQVIYVKESSKPSHT